MEKELLNKFLATMLELLQDAKGFMEKEIPLICQEILKYNFYKSIIESAICTVLLLIVIYGTVKLYKFTVKQDAANEPGPLIVGIPLTVCLFFGVVCNALDAVQIALAPRLYLIEYFTHLIKSPSN